MPIPPRPGDKNYYRYQFRSRLARTKANPNRLLQRAINVMDRIGPYDMYIEVYDPLWTGGRGQLQGGWLWFTFRVEITPGYYGFIELTGNFQTGGRDQAVKRVEAQKVDWCNRHHFPLLLVDRKQEGQMMEYRIRQWLMRERNYSGTRPEQSYES